MTQPPHGGQPQGWWPQHPGQQGAPQQWPPGAPPQSAPPQQWPQGQPPPGQPAPQSYPPQQAPPPAQQTAGYWPQQPVPQHQWPAQQWPMQHPAGQRGPSSQRQSPLQVTAAILSILTGLVLLVVSVSSLTLGRAVAPSDLVFDSAILLGGLTAVAGGSLLFTRSRYASALACLGAGSYLANGSAFGIGPGFPIPALVRWAVFGALPLLFGIATLIMLAIHGSRSSRSRGPATGAAPIVSCSALIFLALIAYVPSLSRFARDLGRFAYPTIHFVVNLALLAAVIWSASMLLARRRVGQASAAVGTGATLILMSQQSGLSFASWATAVLTLPRAASDWITAVLVLATALVGAAIVFLCGPKVTNHAPPLSQQPGPYAQQQPFPQYPYRPQR